MDIEDQFGNLVLTDDSKVHLTLKIKSGPSNAVLVGKHRGHFVNGQLVITNLTVDAPGAYRITVTDTTNSGIPPVNSTKFFVS